VSSQFLSLALPVQLWTEVVARLKLSETILVIGVEILIASFEFLDAGLETTNLRPSHHVIVHADPLMLLSRLLTFALPLILTDTAHMLDDTATPTSSAPPTPRLSARPQAMAPSESSAIRYPVPHILRFLGSALPHAAPAAVKGIKVYALALLRRSVADAGVPVVQDADYCELVLGGACTTLALLTEHHAQDVHYQNMRIACVRSK
jgi:hypothetical protein